MYAKIPTKQWPKDLQKVICVKRVEAGLSKGDLITVYPAETEDVKSVFNASGGRVTESDACKLTGAQ